MATRPIGDQPNVVTLPGTIPHMPAIARILARHDREHLAAFIAVAIDLLDVLEGDPDLENATDAEDDFALSPAALLNADKGPGCPIADSDYCTAGDDCVKSGPVTRAGLVSEDLGPGDADDGENWQQTENVPMPKVFSVEHDPATGAREFLGRANLMSSFRSNGAGVRSADTGATFRLNACLGDSNPGAPV